MLKNTDPLGFSKANLGGHSARSMMFLEMKLLVDAMPLTLTADDFARAIVDENILEKPTLSSRKKSLRHLIELYGLDPSKALFRVLWEFAHVDLDSLPQLCLVCSYARDPQLRQGFELIRTLPIGSTLTREAMEQHLETGFPNRFSPAQKKSMAQNVNTSWTYGGHPAGRTTKTRRLPERGEALALRCDVDLENRVLRVTGSLQRISHRLQIVPPKTKKSARVLSIPKALLEKLRDHRTRQLEERLHLGAHWQNNDLVFCTSIGTMIEPRNIRRKQDALMKDSGMRYFRLHDLRHAFASLLISQGVDLKIISELLGHNSLKITADTYTHLIPQVKTEALDLLDSVLAGEK